MKKRPERLQAKLHYNEQDRLTCGCGSNQFLHNRTDWQPRTRQATFRCKRCRRGFAATLKDLITR